MSKSSRHDNIKMAVNDQKNYSSQERLFIVCKALTFCGDGLLASCPDSDSKVENCHLSNVREGTFSKFGCHV